MKTAEVKPKSQVVSRPKPGVATALWNRPIVLSLLLVIAIVALYYPVHKHPFINYDDGDYVYENPHVKSGLSWAAVQWAFTTSHAENWHPVTWLSHELDCQLFGVKPAGPHDVNVLFHALNAVLLFWVLLRATGFAGRSFMVAALFALHPINVETVVWIAERKNVLSTTFFLLALGAYRWYAKQPRVGRYCLVALLFALGLMAKPQIITLPCVLLLWDYWPLQRLFPQRQTSLRGVPPVAAYAAKSLSWLILEKVPLLLIAAASALITLHVQHGARMGYPRLARAGNGVLSYGLYIKKAVWPTRLAALYPHPGDAIAWWKVWVSGLILLAITALVMVGRRHRYLPVGWFWFLGTLVPMLGIIQVGVQAMADRYAYLSFLGLFLMLCWGAADLSLRLRLPGVALPSASVAALLVLAIVARRQINYWRSDEVLWTHALQVTTNNWVAESQMGTALAMDRRVEEAVPYFYKALAIAPTDATANMGIAIYQLQIGNFSDAIVYYQHVVQIPGVKSDILINAWIGMAKAYRALGDKTTAQQCVEQARRVGNR